MRVFARPRFAPSSGSMVTIILALAMSLGASRAKAQVNYYWDLNGASAGSGADGTAAPWDTATPNWTIDPSGSSPTGTWVNDLNNSAAVFSAGDDASGAYSVTVSGTIQTNAINFNMGAVTLYGTGSPSLTIGSGGITVSHPLATTLDSSLGNIILSASQTWQANSSAGFDVNCGAIASGAYTLTLAGDGETTDTINGVLADGAGTLSLTDWSPWILAGANTYSGPTTVNGWLQVGDGTSGSLSSSSTLILNGGYFQLMGKSAGTTTQTVNGTILDAGYSSIFVDANTGSGTTLNLGAITRNPGAIASGGGTTSGAAIPTVTTTSTSFVSNNVFVSSASNGVAYLTLNQSDWASLSAGTFIPLSMGAGYQTGNAHYTAASNVDVTDGDAPGAGFTVNTLRFNSPSIALTLGGSNTISTGGILVTNNAASADIISGGTLLSGGGQELAISDFGALTISSVIANSTSGPSALSFGGSGTLTLKGANTYTGATYFAAGALNLANANALGPNSGAGPVSISSFNTVLDNTSGSDLVLTSNNPMSISNLTYTGSANSLNLGTGAITLNNPYVTVNAHTLTIGGTLSTYGLTKAGAGTLALNSPLDSNAFSYNTLDVEAGTLILNAANTYSNTPAYVHAGTLQIGAANALPASTDLTVSGGSFDLGGFNQQLNSISDGGSNAGIITSTAGTPVLTIAPSGYQTMTFAGTISGSGLALTVVSPATLVLTGANSYQGATTIIGANLQLGDGTSGHDGSIASTGITDNGALVFDTADLQSSPAAISGSGGILKLGAGYLALSGANTYSGGTTISAGGVCFAKAAALPVSGIITVAGGAGLAINAGGSAEFTNATSGTGSIGAVVTTPNIIWSPGSNLGIDTTNAPGGALTYSGAIGGNEGLYKLGTGTLTLAGSNTYAGATTVTAGTLRLGAANALPVATALTVSGGSFDLAGLNQKIASLSDGNSTSGNITSSAGPAVLNVAQAAITTFGGTISGTGLALTKNNSGTLYLTGADTYTGATTVNAGTLQVGDGTSGSLSSSSPLVLSHGTFQLLGNTSGTTIQTVNGTTANPGFSAINTSNNTGAGATLNLGALTRNAGAIINIGSGGVGNRGTVTTSTSYLSNNVLVSAASNGAAYLTISKTDWVSLNSGALVALPTYQTGNANYTAASNIDVANSDAPAAGFTVNTLRFNSSGISLSLNGSNTISTGGILVTKNVTSGDNISGGSLLAGAGKELVICDYGALTINSVIANSASGPSALTIAGSGTLTLNAANTYTGTTYLDGAQLNLANANALGTATNAGALQIYGGVIDNTSGAGMALAGNNAQTWAASFTYAGSANSLNLGTGPVTLAASPIVTVTAHTLTVGGVISGAYSLTTAGPGTLALDAASTYTGATSVTSGTLRIGTANALPTATPLTVSGGALNLAGFSQQVASLSDGGSSIGIITSTSGTPTFTIAQSAVSSFAGAISGSGLSLTMTGTGTLVLTGANTYGGATTVNSGTLQFGDGTSGHDGSLASPAITVSGALVFDTNASQNAVAAISGPGSLSKFGAGTLTLSGTNTYTGPTSISSGVLQFAQSAALPSASAITVNSGATLAINAGGSAEFTNTTSGPASIGAVLGSAAITWNTGSALGIDTTNAPGAGLTYSGAISGNQGLTKLGIGSLTLAAVNTYSGATTAAGGTLRIATSNALPVNTTLIASGGTFDLGGFNQTIAALSDARVPGSPSGAVTSSSGAATLTIAQAANTTFSGAISGAGLALTKSGPGTLILAGANSYAGATTVTGGTLQTDSLSSSSPLVLAGGSFLLAVNTPGPVTQNINGMTLNAGFSGIGFPVADATDLTVNLGPATRNPGALLDGIGGSGNGPNAVTTSNPTVVNNIYTSATGVAFFAVHNGSDWMSYSANEFTDLSDGAGYQTGSANYTATSNIDVSNGDAPAPGSTVNTLRFNAPGIALTLSGSNTISTGGILVSSNATSASNISGGTIISGPAKELAISDYGALTINSTIANSAAGPSALTIGGTGALTLAGANTYTGTTYLTAGTLNLANANALGPNSGAGALNIYGGVIANAAPGDLTLTSNNPQTWAASFTYAGGLHSLNLGSGPVALATSPTVTVLSQTLTVAGPISGPFSLTKAGPGTLVLTGANSYTGGTSVSAGTLQTKQVANSLTVASGAKLVLASSAGTNSHASIVSSGSLSIATSGANGIGAIDLTDNGLIITGATLATEGMVKSLISGGEIASSVVSAHTGMTIAYDFASDIHLTFTGGNATWGGQTIASSAASSDLLVFPTLQGDLNMDGAVNFTDVTALAPNLGKTTGQTWGTGDLNGDGAVNFTDVTALAPNLGKLVTSLAAPNFVAGSDVVTTAPEPASLILLAFGALALTRRRPRHDSHARAPRPAL